MQVQASDSPHTASSQWLPPWGSFLRMPEGLLRTRISVPGLTGPDPSSLALQLFQVICYITIFCSEHSHAYFFAHTWRYICMMNF